MSPEILDVLEGRKRWALIHGDSAEILPTLPDKSVAHVITDPPYSEHVHGNQRSGSSDGSISVARDLGFSALTDEMREAIAAESGRLCARWALIFSDLDGMSDWRRSLAAHGLEHIRPGIWVKTGAPPQFTGDRPAIGAEGITICHPKGRKKWNGGGSHAVWTFPIEAGGAGRLHTTQKPLPLMLELVELFTDPDDIILDPFAGSGTTGVACLRLGRRFLGIERDATYAAVATERLTAEGKGLTLRAARAGQLSLLGGS